MTRIELIFAALAVAVEVASPAFAQPVPPVQPVPPAPVAPRIAINRSGSFLGVGVADIDAERAKALNLKEERGAEVKTVDDDSPAAKAGLKVGDVILEYNGQRVEGMSQFVRLVGETPVGRQVKLLVSRGGATQTLSATIAGRRGSHIFTGDDFSKLHERMSRMRMDIDIPHPVMSLQTHVLGVEAEPLNSQLAEFFGVKEGVLVRSVIKGSAAEKAGMKAGDVITRVGTQKVAQPGDVSRAIKAIAPAKMVPIVIMRDHKETTLNATIEEKSSEEIHGTPVRWVL
jgi:serine protease Do